MRADVLGYFYSLILLLVPKRHPPSLVDHGNLAATKLLTSACLILLKVQAYYRKLHEDSPVSWSELSAG